EKRVVVVFIFPVGSLAVPFRIITVLHDLSSLPDHLRHRPFSNVIGSVEILGLIRRLIKHPEWRETLALQTEHWHILRIEFTLSRNQCSPNQPVVLHKFPLHEPIPALLSQGQILRITKLEVQSQSCFHKTESGIRRLERLPRVVWRLRREWFTLPPNAAAAVFRSSVS